MSEKDDSKIEATLKKIAAAMSRVNSPTSSNTEPLPSRWDLPGDPNCPICRGLGYYRLEAEPGEAEFGKLHICVCRQEQIGQQVRQRLFALSRLDELSHLTFENFEARGRVGLPPRQADSLERAYNQARQFAQSIKGWLLLQGENGCGKTHLAAAIANYAVSLGVPTLFITVPDMLDTLRFAFDSPEATFEDRFNQIRQAQLLILDDFGTQNASPWAKEKIFQIINYRYINRLPLVVTTNLILADIEERISSRLQDPELVTRVVINAPDYRNPAGDIGHHRLSSLDILYDCTFASFDLRKDEGLKPEDVQSLEKAFRAARQFAEAPRGWLVILGGYNSGKTHLAAAIANFLADSASPPLFISVPDLIDHLRATFNPNSTVTLDRRFEEVRTTPLLILDDLSTQAVTPWAKEKLYQLFNYRYYAKLPTVITTANTLGEMDARLRARMLDTRLCTIYAITAPPYTGGTAQQEKGRLRSKKR